MTSKVQDGIDGKRSLAGELRNASTNFLSAIQNFSHLFPNGRLSIGGMSVSIFDALVDGKRISSGTFIIHHGETEIVVNEVPGVGVRSMVVNGVLVVADGNIDGANGAQVGCAVLKNAANRINEQFAQLLQSIVGGVSHEAREVIQLNP